MRTHVLKYNGYHVAERLLEDVVFEVTVTETDTGLRIDKVAAPTEPAHVARYLEGINTAKFLPRIRSNVQAAIDDLATAAEREGRTILDYLDDWERDYPNESRIEILNEV